MASNPGTSIYFWYEDLARASTSGSSIHLWLEHPLLARASTSGSSIHCWLELQHLLQAPTSVSCPCLLSYGCSTRSTTTSPWSVSNKRGLAVHSLDVHSQSPSQVQGRLLFSCRHGPKLHNPRVFDHVPFRSSKHGSRFQIKRDRDVVVTGSGTRSTKPPSTFGSLSSIHF